MKIKMWPQCGRTNSEFKLKGLQARPFLSAVSGTPGNVFVTYGTQTLGKCTILLLTDSDIYSTNTSQRHPVLLTEKWVRHSFHLKLLPFLRGDGGYHHSFWEPGRGGQSPYSLGIFFGASGLSFLALPVTYDLILQFCFLTPFWSLK